MLASGLQVLYNVVGEVLCTCTVAEYVVVGGICYWVCSFGCALAAIVRQRQHLAVWPLLTRGSHVDCVVCMDRRHLTFTADPLWLPRCV